MASASTHDGNTIPVMAPKDAKGRNVQLDTKLLYSDKGIEFEVDGFTFRSGTAACDAEWLVEGFGPENMICSLPLDSMYLEKPDSLKQLAEDLNRVWDVHGKGYGEMTCHYDKNRGKYCNDCRLNSHGKMNCLDAMMADIVSRVNRLAGDSE